MRDGDEWVVNGQKIWTSMGHLAKFGILIARTDPDVGKHQGITYFICPMDAPGIEVRPIIEMTGTHMFNEVFFDDVRIPAENVVGEVNGGWSLAKVTLGNERVSLSSGGLLWGMGPTRSTCSTRSGPRAAAHDPCCASAWRRCTPKRRCSTSSGCAPSRRRIKGDQPGPEASIRKILADEHGQRTMGLAKDLAGAAGDARRQPTCGATASCSPRR